MSTSTTPSMSMAGAGLPRPWWQARWLPAAMATAVFAALCIVVLIKPTSLLEPDDLAYRASITALTHGQVVLTDAQYQALAAELTQASGTGSAGPAGNQAIAQWVQLPSGDWVSEKNPGYPFLALPFALIGALRIVPLFYGALGCLALYFGGRRWLGRWGGTAAVAMFCTSGAAMVFAWRPTMPTFTDAALIAVGAGALLWAFLARDKSDRARILTGLAGFVALEAAVATRYTNAVFLLVAGVVALMAPKWAGLPRRTIAWWWGSAIVTAAALMAWNTAIYGSPLSTGYSAGLITFSLASVIPNLQRMPALLVSSIPMTVLALIALVWATARWAMIGRDDSRAAERGERRRDGLIVGVLAVGWLGLWALYSAYDWTAQHGTGGPGGPGAAAGGTTGGTGTTELLSLDNLSMSVHLIRFYVPALGLIALLAAWVVVRLPFWAAVSLVALQFGLGAFTFDAMATPVGPGGPGGPPPGFDGGASRPGGP